MNQKIFFIAIVLFAFACSDTDEEVNPIFNNAPKLSFINVRALDANWEYDISRNYSVDGFINQIKLSGSVNASLPVELYDNGFVKSYGRFGFDWDEKGNLKLIYQIDGDDDPQTREFGCSHFS